MNFQLAYSLVRKNLADFTEMRIRAKALLINLLKYVIAQRFARFISIYSMYSLFYAVGASGIGYAPKSGAKILLSFDIYKFLSRNMPEYANFRQE